MFEFSYPFAFALFFLPILVKRFAPPYKVSSEAIRAPFYERVSKLMESNEAAAPVERGNNGQVVLWACWLLLIAALARPVHLSPPITQAQTARDLLLAVDLSGSMEVEDFINSEGRTVSRLEAVKEVLKPFISSRKGDRVGVVVFGSSAFVQAPFTQDLETAGLLLEQTSPKMAGPMTAIGDAVGLSLKLFESSKSEKRVVILLTDGNDTGSQVPPVRAAEIAADRGLVLHTIAVGDPTTAGENALDEETLKSMADLTGGRYLRATDRAGLEEAYSRLEKLEKAEFDSVSYRPKQQLFHWPLSLALILFFTLQLVQLKRQAHG